VHYIFTPASEPNRRRAPLAEDPHHKVITSEALSSAEEVVSIPKSASALPCTTLLLAEVGDTNARPDPPSVPGVGVDINPVPGKEGAGTLTIIVS
jgi:hypothetical protein